MSKRNITKICAFVTIFLSFCLNFAACNFVSSRAVNSGDKKASNSAAEFSADYQKSKTVGTIASNEITESSGIAASRCNENVLWTHNDSGDDAFVFAINFAGKKLGTWKVAGAKNIDWEDIATFKNARGECFLYIGDIGDNTSKRNEFTIYAVKEPKVSANDSSRKNPLATEAAQSIKIKYPDGAHDAETLMIHPQTGDVYILSKQLGEASGVYKLAANFSLNKTNELEKIADFSVPSMTNGFLTGGDIAPDGTRVVICDYFNGYEIRLPENAKSFDEIWKEKPLKIELGKRAQGEAVGYSPDGKSLFATSEGKNPPLIEVDRK